MSFFNLTVAKDYLVLPVSEYVGAVFVGLKIDDKYVKDVILRLDYENPTTYSLLPVSEFKGQEVIVEIDPDSDFRDIQTNDPAKKILGENFRPVIHYTTDYGWTNDPNGLLKYTSPVTGETVYHMFYQLNPYDWIWGNMHWGHAVSKDLYHWERRPIALYPDDMGTMFSGSAIVDVENRSGLKRGDDDVILLFYTAAGQDCDVYRVKKFTQCLAYSTDGGKTFEKYTKNPIVDHIEGGNRDPKVIWCAELGKYVMSLYLDRNDYCILTSENFIDWEILQKITVEGESECPDFYPFNLDGKRKWVFSGASGRYVVGEFENGQFVYDQKVCRLYCNSQSYAAQTISDYDEYKHIQIAWDNTASFGNATFRSQMSVPYKLSLNESDDRIALSAEPFGLDAVRKENRKYENIRIESGLPFKTELSGQVYEIDMSFDLSDIGSSVRFEVFGVAFDLSKNESALIFCNDKMIFDSDTVDLKFIFDKGSVEVFGNGGTSVMTVAKLMNYNRRYLCLNSAEDSVSEIKRLSLTKLEL